MPPSEQRRRAPAATTSEGHSLQARMPPTRGDHRLWPSWPRRCDIATIAVTHGGSLLEWTMSPLDSIYPDRCEGLGSTLIVHLDDDSGIAPHPTSRLGSSWRDPSIVPFTHREGLHIRLLAATLQQGTAPVITRHLVHRRGGVRCCPGAVRPVLVTSRPRTPDPASRRLGARTPWGKSCARSRVPRVLWPRALRVLGYR